MLRDLQFLFQKDIYGYANHKNEIFDFLSSLTETFSAEKNWDILFENFFLIFLIRYDERIPKMYFVSKSEKNDEKRKPAENSLSVSA